MRTFICTVLLVGCICSSAFSKDYQLASPNGKVCLGISIEERIEISVFNEGRSVLDSSPVDLVINGHNLAMKPKVKKIVNKKFDEDIYPIVKIKSDKIRNYYNELQLEFKGNYSILFRAYDEGVAYRFQSNMKGLVEIDNEVMSLHVPTGATSYMMKEKSFFSYYDTPYSCSKVEIYKDSTLFSLPGLFKTSNGDFLLFAESDLVDYPGMYLRKVGDSFEAALPEIPTKTKTDNCISEQYVTERANIIARTEGKRNFPWRVFMIADSEKKLLTNQMVYMLSTPPQKRDYSWIKPGQATLDWWGRRSIHGTEFVGGVNTETFKYFIDFNNKYGIDYFVMDEGWSETCNLRNVNKAVDLDEVSAYAKKKGVKLIFWMHAFVLKQDIGGYLDFLKSKGADGIKVDFFARDDQEVINLIHTIAREARDRELIVDFHGICKPFGLERTYPNVLTSEALIEFEMNGVTDWANPQHHTYLPFLRMMVGPMDYLPGTFYNTQKNEFYMNIDRPVGLGSRSHSMALAVLFESPLTMLPDSPSDYLKEDECCSFLTKIPVVWDETKIIDAKIGEYVVLARRKGRDWFLAAITNWDARVLNVNLDFLGTDNYTLDYFMDGKNTNTRAIDYVRKKQSVHAKNTIKMVLAKGGGWVGKITTDL